MILPYPPGITVLEPGEVWTDEALSYFLFLQKYKSAFPDFSPEILGVHGNGMMRMYGCLKPERGELRKR